MFCLDTNIVIFGLNGRRPAISRRLDVELARGTELLAPAMVLFELRYGIAKSDRRAQSERQLDAFLAAGIKTLAFDAEDATEAGEIRALLEAGHADRPLRLSHRRPGPPPPRRPRHAQQTRVRACAGADRDGLGGMNKSPRPPASARALLEESTEVLVE